MLIKTKIAIAVAIVLTAASAAWANEPTGADGGGYRVQSWQASTGRGGYDAYGQVLPNRKTGLVAAPAPSRHLSREND